MRHLTIGDIRLALRDLLGDKLDMLRRSETGKLYESRLRAKQQEIEALPEAADPRAPLADLLATADRRHDGLGAAIFYFCQAIESHPAIDADRRETARRVRETFVPRLEVLGASYADQAAAALDGRGKLGDVATAAKALATPGGGSLHGWLKAFIDAGDDIDRLLRERAGVLATAENAAATGALRGATIGLLGRFRAALRDEMEDDQAGLPADHEARLFAYIDKLGTDRAPSGRIASEGAGETDAGPEPDAAPDAEGA